MAGRVELASAARRLGRGGAVAWGSRLSFFVLCCLSIFAAGSPARALVIGPGDSLEVTFVFASPPSAGSETIDLLVLTTTPFSASGPGIAVTAQLYDGATLLASGVRPSAALITFSDGAYGDAIAASLDTLRNGTIQGRIVLTPDFAGDTGYINFTPENFQVRGAHGFTQSVILASPGADILSVGIPSRTPNTPVAATPVPAAMLLFGSALAVLVVACLRRRPRIRDRTAA